MPKEAKRYKFTVIGKGKYVHAVLTKAHDLKKSECQALRKAVVADRIDYRKGKFLSPEAASALPMCTDCHVPELVAAYVDTPTKKREQRKQTSKETLERIAAGSQDKPKRKKTGADYGAMLDNKTLSKKEKDRRQSIKDGKPVKVSPTKSGPRSIASGKDKSASMNKAEQLAEFGKQHGWRSTFDTDEDGRVTVIAVKDDMTIRAPFIDGKFDEVRWGSIEVGSWSGRLRAAHYTRRQMSMDNPPYPRPGEGRSGPRTSRKAEDDPPADESPEDARKRVPFSMDDDDLVILHALQGTTIRWRNKIGNTVEEAKLPAEPGKGKRPAIAIKHHPKSNKPMVTFFEVVEDGSEGEVFGPERTVALDRILRVAG